MPKKILLLGSKSLGLRVLERIFQLSTAQTLAVITFNDQQDCRSCFSDFQQFTKNHQIELIVVNDQNHANCVISELKPDICFVVGWYWLIPEKILQQVPMGFIGLHNSLLPQYRGGSPLVWTLINGDKQAGFSFFTLTTGMDDGPIWAQGQIAVSEEDTIADCLAALEAKSLQVFTRIYPQILSGQLQPKPQNHEQASYCALRYPEDGKINWHWSARQIKNFIRAQTMPYPGAFTLLNGKRVIIWQAQVFSQTFYGIAGQVAQMKDEQVVIVCGDNTALIVKQVQVDDQLYLASTIFKSIKLRL
ncbi:methionyl-tRNA formyltransferase [Spartinivicinus ruber]|uniref:methionyl-tRNA formyltransferase n=1 Tax=Spartinivicinus ruber TaxID=2683272 RepID=UPI0013D1F3D0|nr:methionyl-tRNA formyltransferase [Spartinivicinus ruber]